MMERNKYVDKLKGFLVVLVLYGHSVAHLLPISAGEANSMYDYIYSFHNGFFMLTAGYVLFYSINKSINKLVVKRSISLIVPALVFGAIRYIPYFIKEGFDISRVKYCFITVGLWFLYDVALNTVLIVFIYKIFKNRYIQLAVTVCVGIAFLVAYKYIPILRAGVLMFPFFAAGFYYNMFSKEAVIIKAKNVLSVICAFLFPYVILLYVDRPDSIFLMNWVAGFSAVLFITFVFRRIELPQKIENTLISYGEMCLQMYVIQAYLLPLLFDPIIGSINIELNEIIIALVVAPAFTLIMIVMIKALTKLISKSKLLSMLVLGRELKRVS